MDLKKLQSFLEEYDTAAETYIESLEDLSAAAGYKNEILKIKNDVNKYDYDAALAAIKKLLKKME
ncbi:MAG: hypothetical protein JW881_06465 [Spirochaetales bacterium]|nr:hypothetical protein [Spirochaetales bacterium]